MYEESGFVTTVKAGKSFAGLHGDVWGGNGNKSHTEEIEFNLGQDKSKIYVVDGRNVGNDIRTWR